jgi:hypothetical protein
MNKNENVRKKMDQLLIEESAPIRLEELHLVLIKRVLEMKEKAIKNAIEQYNFYNSLNPRYNEQHYTPKNAQIKLDAINLRSNQGLIRPY